MWRLQQDSEGWTQFPESDNIQRIFVNREGDDSNPGTIEKPVKTLKRAWSLRLGNGNQLKISLFRGQEWPEPFSFTNFYNATPDAPTIITSYGSALEPPKIIISKISHQPVKTSANYIVFAHLDLQGNNTEHGFNHVGRKGLWIEGCWLHNFHTAVVFQSEDTEKAECQDLILRRNCIYDNYGPEKPGHPQGTYVAGVRGTFLIDGNLFDKNGWMKVGDDNIYNHNIYLNGYNDPVMMSGNISARGASHGAQLRCGGVLRKHLSIDNAIHVSFGLVNGGGAQHAGGIQDGIIEDLVIFGGHKINSGNNAGNRGWGIEFANIDLTTARRIFIADENIAEGGGPAIKFEAAGADDVRKEAVGILDLEITELVTRNWSMSLEVEEGMGTGDTKYSNQKIKRIVISGSAPLVNSKNAKAVQIHTVKNFPTNNRDIKTYLQLLSIEPGSDPKDTFLQLARKQSRFNWKKELTSDAVIAYITAPFGWAKDPVTMSISADVFFTNRSKENLGPVTGSFYGPVAIEVLPIGTTKPKVTYKLNGEQKVENSPPFVWPADDGAPIPRDLPAGNYVLNVLVEDSGLSWNQTYNFVILPPRTDSTTIAQQATMLSLQARSAVLQLNVAAAVTPSPAVNAALVQVKAVAAISEKIKELSK